MNSRPYGCEPYALAEGSVFARVGGKMNISPHEQTVRVRFCLECVRDSLCFQFSAKRCGVPKQTQYVLRHKQLHEVCYP